ncbi:alkaline phosphatase [Sphaerisporangium krabiense]|uniref:Alkaline phosphatase D n=1 Tax=Sphaerisporangium krabiense TaxID=763782 RepID=A0A7W8Z8K1_9ACTN|nr:alkaline phosphatase D family protein [Sphaerisporangium krabiense]MBB5629474.1 alkaline phosphatase D [Sphaerisporangium krabiense]GII65675.1 alkaline phosphatase [Sphaerisporangium krabiense]
MQRLDRRSFLVTGLAAGAIATVPAASALAEPDPAAETALSLASRGLRTDPFQLGVASGDPDHDGFVIWTRLAPQPLAEDGAGGMPSRPFTVLWQVYADERLRHVVRAGVAIASPEWGHSVHVEVGGLQPGREYWYRFRLGSYVSPAGRTRTAPHPLTLGGPLSMAFVSCAQYEHGYFTSYRRLAEDHPDLVLHLGDYQYEYTKDTYTIPGGNVRDHEGPETETLAGYRQRHAQYKADLDLQAAHAAAPWLVVWDDHELDNNWADEVPERPDIPQPNFLARREAAFRAYYENMPLRRTSVPRGIDMQLYRRIRWGRLATFHMLDTRQFRDDQACGDGFRDCPAALDPARSITGPEQEAWLIDGFRQSRAQWDILGQQVFFGQRDNNAGPAKVTSMDAWDGYVASRQRITQGWVDAKVRNAVVLTGDVHAHWAGDLKLDYDDPDGRVVGSELVATSISTGGDGADSDPATQPFLKINPHLKFYNNQRGYVLTKVERDQLTADFRVVPHVQTPGAAVHTKATFVVEDRVPGVRQTYLRPADPALRTTGAPTIEDTVRLETDRP